MALTNKMKIPKNATFVLSSICLYTFLEDDYYLQLSILGETHNLKILPKNETLQLPVVQYFCAIKCLVWKTENMPTLFKRFDIMDMVYK